MTETPLSSDFALSVLDSIQDTAVVIDREGVIVLANEPWRAFAESNSDADCQVQVGATTGVGSSYFREMRPEAGDLTGAGDAFAGVRQVLAGATERFELEYPCHGPTERRWFRMSAVPVAGEPGYVLIRHTNVSTLRYAKEELVRAKEAAERGNLVKSRFLAAMSHELRTPLNAILGFSETMMLGAFGPIGDPRYVDHARIIHDSGQHLLAVLNDVLDMAKIEAGKIDVHKAELRLAPLLKTCVDSMRCDAEARGLSFTIDADPALTCHADARLFKQVALNLISNAIKFSPKGGTITVEGRAAEDGSVSASFCDQGPGIHPDQIDTVFREFEQTDLGREAGGAGLGLPISANIARLHGGALTVQNRVSGGLRATITLPPAQDAKSRANSRTASAR
ncbi:MAG: ATP-binding protein [Alphaproteobacteria bacterium]|nr:ATP-binding protein [Alphaproteobacteria bacterium]